MPELDPASAAAALGRPPAPPQDEPGAVQRMIGALLGTGGQERYQLWPERAVRGAVEAAAFPGDYVRDYAPGQPVSPAAADWAAGTGLTMVGAPGVPGGTLGSGAKYAAKSALPMDEASRMSRALEQGYNIDAYKGMYPYDWRTVPETNWKGKVIPGTEDRVPQAITSIDARETGGRDAAAGFFSNDPAVASRFGEIVSGGSVYPVKLKMQNPKIIDAQGAYAADFQFGAKSGNQLKLPEDSPHDGVILKNTRDEGDVYLPREPSQIRSRFAKFDPNSIDSDQLLAGLAGAGVTAGVGAAASRDR